MNQDSLDTVLRGEELRLALAITRLRTHLNALPLHLDDPSPFGPEVGQSLTAATGDVVTLLARIDTLRRALQRPSE